MAQDKDQSIFRQTGDGSFQLDLIGYGCPHVQIYAEKALKKLRSGEQLTVVFDSPASGESLSWLFAAQGDELTGREESAGTFTWTVRKA